MKSYDNIIELPHFEPKYHQRMSIYNRSAQFAPFAALTGYEDAVKEKGRLTDNKIELTEDTKNLIDMELQQIAEHIKEHPMVKVLYFVKDIRKSGGKYTEYVGRVKKIDSIEYKIVFQDGFSIDLDNIMDIINETSIIYHES